MKSIVLIVIILSSNILFSQKMSESGVNLDSLERLLNFRSGAAKVKLLSDLCWEFGPTDVLKAEKYGKMAIELAKKIKNDTLIAFAHNDMGSLCLRLGEYPKARANYEIAIKIRTKLKDKIGLAAIYSKLAVLEEIQGDFPKALDMNLKVLKIYEKENLDKSAIGTLYSNISVILYNMNHLDRAYSYNKTAFEIGEKINNSRIIANAYGNFGALLTKKNDFKKAIKNYKLAINYFQKDNNLNSIAACYNNIGNSFSALNFLDSAFLYYQKSLEIRVILDDRNGIMSLKTNLSSIYIKKGNPDKAIKLAKEALIESLALSTRNETKNLYEHLAKAYSMKKDFGNAYKYQNLYIAIKDSIFSQETTTQIAEMSSKYESGKKESQILLLKKAKEIQEVENKKQKVISITLIVGFILVLTFSIFIINRLLIIRKQKTIIESQKHLVEEKNKEITDSITYAKRIQSAILPQPKLVKEYFKESFILYKPKDIVAGDFYWFEVIDDLIFFAAADCTGHGVPGALVSVVCHNALNRSVKEFNLKKPSDILDKTREIVISEFEKSDEDVKDGMDISLCVIDLKSNLLNWSGAHNPLWILKKNSLGLVEVFETKANKQPIGKFAFAKPFTNHEIQLFENDEIYISTDGFQDQFGGAKGKKFKASEMKEILILNSHKTMNEKLNLLDQTFENWKGELEQVDDVCIIGVRL